MYKTVIFDLDGTLLNMLTDLSNAVNYALEKCGLSALPSDKIRLMLGDGYNELIRRAVGDRQDKCTEAYKLFTEYYNEHLEDFTKPYDGTAEMLKQLHHAGIKMAVVSNKGDSAVQSLCAKFFAPYITCYFGVTPSLPKKPAPDMLLAAMSALNSDKNSTLNSDKNSTVNKVLNSDKSTTVMIGDGEADIEMARRAGIPILCASWGYRTREFLLSEGATTILNNILEIPAHVLG